jgi:hypothetical protein
VPITGPGSPWSRRGGLYVPEAAGGGGSTPETYTLYPSVDGVVYSNNASYATARAGGSLGAGAGGTTVGQATFPPYYIFECFYSFDTSAVVGTVQSATFQLYGNANSSATDFIMEARLKDFGATVTTVDWVGGDSLAALPLLATFDTAGWSLAGYNEFTSEAAFISNINQSGFTRILVASSRHRTGDAPTGDEMVDPFPASEAGTTKDPKLVIEALV